MNKKFEPKLIKSNKIYVENPFINHAQIAAMKFFKETTIEEMINLEKLKIRAVGVGQ